MVNKVKFIVKITAKIPAWRQGNVPFPSARFWHSAMLLRHAMHPSMVCDTVFTLLTLTRDWSPGRGTADTYDVVWASVTPDRPLLTLTEKCGQSDGAELGRMTPDSTINLIIG